MSEPDELQQMTNALQRCVEQIELAAAVLAKLEKQRAWHDVAYKVINAEIELEGALRKLDRLGYTPQEVVTA